MPIIELQQRLREIGRIRMGEKGPKGQPVKLDKFRLTSQDKSVLVAAAAMYGGTVRPWAAEPGQFELYITAEELPILVSPVEESQWYEQWTAGGCTHRCDGCTETIQDRPCQCDPEKRTCKLTTRASVMLPELPSLGVWRLESHGYYAATEIPTSLAMLRSSARKGEYIPASLAIEHRTVKRNNETKKFIVPVLRLRRVLSDVLNIRGQDRSELPPPKQMLPNGVAALPPSMTGGDKAKTFGLNNPQATELKAMLPKGASLPGVLADAYDLGVRSFEGMKAYLADGDAGQAVAAAEPKDSGEGPDYLESLGLSADDRAAWAEYCASNDLDPIDLADKAQRYGISTKDGLYHFADTGTAPQEGLGV